MGGVSIRRVGSVSIPPVIERVTQWSSGEVALRSRARVAACLLVGLGWLGLSPLVLRADDAADLRQAHAWGRFGKGSWRQVRIVTESFDADGKLVNSSTTDNTTTLDEITPERISLRVEVTVEVAGQKFPSQPQIIRQGYAGESVGQTVSIKPLKTETVTVGDRQIVCDTEQIEILGGQSKEVSLVHYSPRLTPRVLRRRSTTSDVASGKTMQESVSEVVKLNESQVVLGEPKNAYRVRLVQKSDRGTTTTLSVHVPEVPGEVVRQTSEKMDASGKLERRSKLDLVGYGVESDDTLRETGGRRARRNKRGR